MKYYFVSYKYKNLTMSEWEMTHMVLDEHPMKWLENFMETYHAEGEQCKITFYSEIEKEHYDALSGWVN